MLVSHWNIFTFHMHTCMKEFYYPIVDNKMSWSIQDTSRLCMISILMVHRKSGSPGVLWSPNMSMTLKWSLLIFSVKISPVRCDAWTNKMSCACTWCAGLNLFGFPKVLLPLWFIHSLYCCFSANYWHHKSQLDPGTDGEDKEACTFGWRLWHFQDCHHP